MEKIKIAIVGNGDRASVYGGYVKEERDDAEIVAVVDPNPFKREEGKKKYNLPDDMLFESIDEFIKRGKIADAVFNCTMDNLHVSTSIPLMKAGYDILLEKPITADKDELFELKKCAEECGVTLMICHLLRYTPFYRGIKQLILDGEIGHVRHMETNENVGILHASNSYIRGKWNNSVACGSGMLLAKCCHDMDYICWLNNETEPEKVSSFGKRSWFIPENAPKGSGTRCLVDCPPEIEKNCIFSAKKVYIDHDNYPHYAWQCINKEPCDINREERIESLKTFNPHHSNLYPNYATNVQLYGGDDYPADYSYEQYVENYCKTYAPQILSYDFYPVHTTYISPDYYVNMSVIREYAAKYEIPFWTYIQCSSFRKKVKVPDAGELRWLVNSSLAYGCKGLQYFTYVDALSSGNEQFRGSPIDKNGNKTVTYDYISEINKFVAKIDEVLMCSFSKGVMIAGETPCKIPEKDILSSYGDLSSVNGESVLVGCFDYKGKNAYHVVNNSLSGSSGATLTFGSEVFATCYSSSVTENKNGKSLSFNLSAGEAVLVVIG